MSLDLYQQESAERMSVMPLVRDPEASAFDGFIRGVGLYTMRGLARTARGIDMLGSVGPVMQDAVTGGTVAQDRYFKEHDDVWGSAVDYWTPRSNEVGVAGQVVGEVASMIPQVLASPSLAVGSLQLGTAEDLVKKGVEAQRANVVGAVEGAGLGLGIWMPVLGSNLWQRLVVGAGANVTQGVVTRGAAQILLEGTPAADEFKAFDGQALTLDALLGMAFGGLAHVSPAMRAQSEHAWERLASWAEGLPATDKAAIAALRLGEHLNVDSVPGKPATNVDVEAHVQRMRQAIEQLERGQPVEVSDLAEPKTEADPKRWSEAERRTQQLEREAERVAKTYDIAEPEQAAPAPEQKTEGPAANRGVTEPPPPRGSRGGEAAGPEAKAEADPMAREAERLVAEQPDLVMTVGSNADGTPIKRTVKEYMAEASDAVKQAKEDVKLFEAAAMCLFGRGV